MRTDDAHGSADGTAPQWSRGRFDGQEGFTLIELLIAVVIMGLAIVAVLGGLLTLVSASGLHRQQSDVSGVVESAAEIVKSDAYIPCSGATGTSPPAAYYNFVPATAPNDVKTSSGSIIVMFWNGTSFGPLNTCNFPPYSDMGLQQIQISFSSTGSSPVKQTVTIVKGNP